MNRVAIAVTVGVFMVSSAVPAHADPTAEATEFLRETVDEILLILANKGTPLNDRLREIEAVAQRRFDFAKMSKLVLGRNRKKLDDTQQEQFTVEFKRHLSITYGRQIEKFTDEKVEIAESRVESNGDVTVKTRLVGGSVDGILVDYRLRNRDGGWRVLDVIPEGISLIQNFRAQIQEIVSAEGADRLIEILREKNERDQEKSAADSA